MKFFYLILFISMIWLDDKKSDQSVDFNKKK